MLGFFSRLEETHVTIPRPSVGPRLAGASCSFRAFRTDDCRVLPMEDCSTASFYQWQRKLQRSSPRGGPAFVPVDHAPAMVERHIGSRTEITLPVGAVVKLPNNSSLSQQRDLLRAILHATTSSDVTS